ncbi:hypothetical protein Murmansk-063 [Murmansk poxvirus]|uniref:CPXV078 protein n=1 Tax=Murmansk poxvirus TaxID=2025359 RepID=A0A223FMQ1_9POXV|nr:hypothetical protein CKM52_gp063 [Murmansk poxvirus]AST09258.1 hypothetical protein Murmansk-063 [Murmansk poxvirus]
MFMYPDSARKALSKLISKNLQIEKVSKKYQLILLEYGLHGVLPNSLYDDAIKFDILNIRFFSPDVVKVVDIINAFQNLCRVDNNLKDIVIFHKKSLMVSGLNVVKLMLEFNLLLSSDIEWMVTENIVNVVHLLKINASMINFKISLSTTEIIDLVKELSIEDIIRVYSLVNNLDLATILHISNNYNVPPLHNILYTFYDVNECIKLVKKYPMDNVIEFINTDVKFNPVFINEVKEFVNKNLPNLYDNLNEYLVSIIPKDDLLKEYRIKTVAMFGFDYNTDVSTLYEDEKDFIKYNISYYDFRCRKFADAFRLSEPKCIPMKVGDVIRRKRVSFKSTVIRKEKDSLEDILKHIDNAKRKKNKVTIDDMEKILSSFHLNPCIARRIIISSTDTKTKIMALKVVKNWKSYVLSQCINSNGIVTETINELSTKILHHHRIIFKYLSSVTTNSDITNCKCSKCDILFFTDLKSIDADLFTDDGIVSRLYDLTRYAMHGKINQNLVGVNCWGPLADMMFHENKRKRLSVILKNIKWSNILVCGEDIYPTLSNIVDTPSFKLMIDPIYVLNDQYAKVVIFFNTIIEYIVSTVYYRLAILGNNSNVREFVSKVLNTVVEACGILFHHVKVDKKVECELEEMSEKGVIPNYLYNLSLNVVSTIFDDINGTS